MRILDVSAGHRAVWFDKHNKDVTFIDIRPEVNPDVVADSRFLPFKDKSFDFAVFDPPHVNVGKNSNMAKDYGHHTSAQIRELVVRTSHELWRTLKTGGFVALKWNDHDQKLGRILDLMWQFTPLFGHKVASKLLHSSSTYWVMLVPGC